MGRALARRIARLEKGTRKACPECGSGAERAVFEVKVPVAVGSIWNAQEPQDPPEPRRCPRCGRQTEFFIRFPEARKTT
ncbi:MAG: hypothetical protein Q9O74_12150 [Planctomycetota bacterium]|nr:hypothetical protein [Planctomycetota bacterium]